MSSPKWQPGTTMCRIDTWPEFAKDLAGRMRLLAQKPDRHLVIDRLNPTRYVQFASQKDGAISAEAVSNHYLLSHERLSPAIERQLVELGWNKPGRSRTNPKNFWREFPPPLQIKDLLALTVRTARHAFGIQTPLELRIRCGEFPPTHTAATISMTTRVQSGAWIQPAKNPALRLAPGLIVRNAISGREYRVGKLLGAGGFGAAYQAEQVGGRDHLTGSLALKVSVEPRGFYREAYFGDLLADASGIVRTHEAFAWAPQGREHTPLYCLISEHVEGGDLTAYLRRQPDPWPEWRARREIVRLTRAVSLIHTSGAVHRDITPNNVFVSADRMLKLGDFGIASHRIGRRDVPADAFNGWFAPPGIQSGREGMWRQADDVYHLGQLFALLLHGGGKSRLTAQDARKLACSAGVKAVIQRCIGERRKRFTNAGEMLAALEKQEPAAPRRATVRSLAGKRVVFTGPLQIPRAQAERLVKRAGGIVEKRVSHHTDVVVLGDQSPHWKAEKKGQKLLDVDRERELGHIIALISERRFYALVRY